MTIVLRGTGDAEEYETGDGVTFAALSGHDSDEPDQIVSLPAPTTAPSPGTVAQAPTVAGPTTLPAAAPVVVDAAQYRTVQLISGGKMTTVRFELRKPDAVQTTTTDEEKVIPNLPGNDQ
jgi:hypothetical protein